MAENNPHVYDPDKIAHRLRLVRAYVSGDNQSAFARRAGFSQTRWNDLENNYPVNIKTCRKILEIVPELSLDWIVYGDEARMDRTFLRHLRAVGEEFLGQGAQLFQVKGMQTFGGLQNHLGAGEIRRQQLVGDLFGNCQFSKV